MQGTSGDISIPTSPVVIGADGSVRVGEQQVGQLRVVNVAGSDAAGARERHAVRGRRRRRSTDVRAGQACSVIQGAIEGANLAPVEGLVALIETVRGFETYMRAAERLDQVTGEGHQRRRSRLRRKASMIRALYTAATGLEAQQLNIDVIANNLANVSTSGFKKSRADFQDLLYQTSREPGGPATSTTQSSTGIQVGLGVRPAAVQRINSQGDFNQTTNPLDVAIERRRLLPGDAAGRLDRLHARRAPSSSTRPARS